MLSTLKILAAVTAFVVVTGCSHSPTKADFGNSVRNMVAKQQVGSGGPLGPDQPLESTDGRRMESVARVYQTHVGDPGAVVVTKEVRTAGEAQ